MKGPLSQGQMDARRKAAAASAKAARSKRRTKKCAVCEATFEVTPGGIARKYCSHACGNKARAFRTYEKHDACTYCRATMPDDRRERNLKTCSPACHRASAATKMKGRKPKRTLHNQPKQASATDRWYAARLPKCEWCGSTGPKLSLHHVIYAQNVEDWGGNKLDPRNAMTLCASCHLKHHNGGSATLPTMMFRDEHWEFAVGLFGEFAFDYLIKRYEGAFDVIASEVLARVIVLGKENTGSLDRFLGPEGWDYLGEYHDYYPRQPHGGAA